MQIRNVRVGSFVEAATYGKQSMAEAITLATRQAADRLKTAGRQAIAAGGFGPRWQNTFRVEVYPRDKPSLTPAVWVYHKIPYAGAFEYGSTHSGKPLMWLPTKNAPARIGVSKATPRLYVKNIGPLKSAQAGRTPLLVATKGVARNKRERVMFVGVRSVTIPKKFSVTPAVEQAARLIPELYYDRLKAIL